MRCDYPGCVWQAIAASAAGAYRQYAEHVVDEHAVEVDIDIPDGMVQVRTGDDEEWQTVTPEEAKRLHEQQHF